MRFERAGAILGLGVAVSMGAATAAEAVTTVWNFQAQVRNCYAGAPVACSPTLTDLGIDDGTPMTGSLWVDDALAGSVLNATTSQYNGSILAGEFVVGDLTLALNAPGGLTAAVDRVAVTSPPAGTSLYRIFSVGLNGLDTSPAGPFGFSAMVIDLVDSGQDFITTTDMPTAPPDLADLDSYDIANQPFVTSISFNLDGDLFYAEITSLTQSVPEPTTALLLALGLGLAVRQGRRSSASG